MTAAFFFFNGILLVIGSVLAFLTRKVYSAFRESQIIGINIYTITLLAIAILPILYLPTSSLPV